MKGDETKKNYKIFRLLQMNFYDVYTTLSLNPEAEHAMNSICQYCNCQNELETLKRALWKKPNRSEVSGAFPFDEETGKIYDVLWKAAQTENYSTLGKIGRTLMKLVCPPADDEGMGRFHAKYHETPEDYYEPAKPAPKQSPQKSSNYSSTSNAQSMASNSREYQANESYSQQQQQIDENDNNWQVDDDENEVVVAKSKEAGVTKRGGNKKND